MAKCALVIGHSVISQGAVNPTSGLTEFDFNDELAKRIESASNGVEIQRIFRRSYRELPGDINQTHPDFIISLHCNAFNRSASGTEVLYYHRSQKSHQVADILLRHLVNCLELPNRGSQPKTTEDRGGFLLRYTHSPCVISEPFFIDNNADLERVQSRYDQLVSAYTAAIAEIAQTVVAGEAVPA